MCRLQSQLDALGGQNSCDVQQENSMPYGFLAIQKIQINISSWCSWMRDKEVHFYVRGWWNKETDAIFQIMLLLDINKYTIKDSWMKDNNLSIELFLHSSSIRATTIHLNSILQCGYYVCNFHLDPLLLFHKQAPILQFISIIFSVGLWGF